MTDDNDQHIPNSVRNSSLLWKCILYPIYGAFWLLNRAYKPKE